MLWTHGNPTQLISRDLPSCQSLRCIFTITPPPLFRNLVRGWNPQKAVSALRNAQCVFLDVDSTLSNQEGLDELARYLGKDKAVCQLTEQWSRFDCVTDRAMSGEMTVEDAFAERIRLLSPTRQEIASFLQSHTPQINPGVASFLSLLRKRGTAFYLVSGGFLEVGLGKGRDVVDRASLPRSAGPPRPCRVQSLSLRRRRLVSRLRHVAMDVQKPREVARDQSVFTGIATPL